MSKSEIQYLLISGAKANGIAMPTANFTTDEVDMSTFPGPFIIQVNRTVADGTVEYCMQFSNDLVNWSQYSPKAQLTKAVPLINQDYYPEGNTSLKFPIGTGATLFSYIQDQSCIPKYLRLLFVSSGSPTGTLTISISKSK